MFNKLYDKLKKYIKESKIELIIFLITIFLIGFPLPYYINMPGGLLNTKDRVEIKNSTKSKGSYNMAYVSQIKATPSLYLFALINHNWDIEAKDDMVLEGQSMDDLFLYERLLLNESSANAKMVAYKKANKEYKEKKNELTIVYITKQAKTDLKVGDIIVSVDDVKINDFDDLKDIIKTKKENDILEFKIIRNNKNLTKTATLYKEDNEVYAGISLIKNKEVTTTPNCKLKFENKESGPSGGLITALTIYDYLIKEDLTNGLVISGTGTMEEDGSVGEIGGVKYKLAGVVKEEADIFFVPAGLNYEEAIKEKEENNYDIDIIGVSNFDEAVDYLNSLKH